MSESSEPVSSAILPLPTCNGPSGSAAGEIPGELQPQPVVINRRLQVPSRPNKSIRKARFIARTDNFLSSIQIVNMIWLIVHSSMAIGVVSGSGPGVVLGISVIALIFYCLGIWTSVTLYYVLCAVPDSIFFDDVTTVALCWSWFNYLVAILEFTFGALALGYERYGTEQLLLVTGVWRVVALAIMRNLIRKDLASVVDVSYVEQPTNNHRRFIMADYYLVDE